MSHQYLTIVARTDILSSYSSVSLVADDFHVVDVVGVQVRIVITEGNAPLSSSSAEAATLLISVAGFMLAGYRRRRMVGFCLAPAS